MLELCLSRHCASCVQQARAVERTASALPLGGSALVFELSDWEEMLAVSQPLYEGAKSVMHHLREPLMHWILQVVLAETLDLGYTCWISSALLHLMHSGSSKCRKFSYHRIENFGIRSRGTELCFPLSPASIYQVGRLVVVTVQIQEVVGWKIFQVIYVEEISKH